MIVVSATFGALSKVQLMHAICHFKAQEVNNPMLQTVHNLELKWRSYSHCKSITLSWRKHFAKVLRNHPFVAKWFRNLFVQCGGFPLEVARYIRQVGSWEPQDESQLCSVAKSGVCCKVISQPFFVHLQNLADLVCTCEMVPSASRYLQPTLGDIFHQIFVV